jgi:hypothetical protein
MIARQSFIGFTKIILRDYTVNGCKNLGGNTFEEITLHCSVIVIEESNRAISYKPDFPGMLLSFPPRE